MFFFASLASSAFIHSHEERSFVAHMRAQKVLFIGEEYHLRLGIFLAKSRHVQEFNSENHGFELELNQFATMTPAEARVYCGYYPPSAEQKRPITRKLRSRGALPASYDWRTQKVVQVIKDQGKCGSCWTFGAIAAQESAWAISFNQLYSLSEQNLLDCVVLCKGCDGGNAILAYFYVFLFQNGYFNTEANYPYTARAAKCAYSSKDATTYIVDFGGVVETETALQNVLYDYGPVAVAIDASHNSFQLYKSGIYNEPACSSTKLDHEVCVIGWGAGFWLVKNSWGTSWGESGYIRMTKGSNQCGIATDAVIPFVTDE
jgi:cathepsin L